MPEIILKPVEGTVVVRAGGAVIAESAKALELHEDGQDPVIYIPREDVGMAFLDPSETRKTCPLKGEATHFHIAAKSGPIRDAAWSYEAPVHPAGAIAGMIAFSSEKAAVEVL
jgi:uncharacterized protein (DUF427 family)